MHEPNYVLFSTLPFVYHNHTPTHTDTHMHIILNAQIHTHTYTGIHTHTPSHSHSHTHTFVITDLAANQSTTEKEKHSVMFSVSIHRGSNDLYF